MLGEAARIRLILPVTRSTKNVVVLIVSLLLTVLAAEAFLRAIDPVGTRYLDELRTVDQILRYDTVVSYRFAPHSALPFRDWTLSVNDDGMRGPELPRAKRPGVFRVLLLGDSLALGWGVPWEHTVGGQLGSLLSQQRGGPVEVVVSAVHSWNTVTEMRDLYARFHRLDPDAVFLLYINNDQEQKAEVEADAHGEQFVVPPVPGGWNGLAWVRSVQALIRLATGGVRMNLPPFDPAETGSRASMDALRACRDLCRAARIPFRVISFGSDERMRALLRKTADELDLAWWDYAADFPSWYLKTVRNSPLDSHFGARGHRRLAERIVASAGSELFGAGTKVGRSVQIEARGVVGHGTAVPWGFRYNRGVEIPANITGPVILLARPVAGLGQHDTTVVKLDWSPAAPGLPSKIAYGVWTPLMIPPARGVPRRVGISGNGDVRSSFVMETTPILTLTD